MPRQEPLNLLDLPIDILAFILSPLLILPNRQPVELCPCAQRLPFPAPLLTVLLIHPAIHAIACPLFYEGNAFVLDLTGQHTNHVRHLLQEFEPLKQRGDALAEDLTAAVRLPLLASLGALRRIASLELRIDKFRGWIVTDAVPLLKDMVMRGGLVSLCVSIHSIAGRGHNPLKSGQAVQSRLPPSDAVLSAKPLLSLLADPYLRVSRLRVDSNHGSAWCRFHPGSGCQRTHKDEVVAKLPGPRPGTGSEGRHFVDIDWSLVIHDIDPEGRELVPVMLLPGGS